MSSTVTVSPHPAGSSQRPLFLMLAFVTLVGLFFIVVAALPYFRLDPDNFRTYWPRRWWLLAHIATGIVALMTGPVQLWLGLTDRRPALHRSLGMTYLTAIVISSMTAYYLAVKTDGGVVFGSGLAGLATAWLITSGLAFVSIRRHLVEQHKEWMIRSYVVTTAFVTFRLLFAALPPASLSLPERLGIASWACWAVPLLITEACLQGRKIKRVATRDTQRTVRDAGL